MSARGDAILLRYARALHELAAASGQAERVEGELEVVALQFREHPELRAQMANPRLSRGDKRAILTGLLQSLALDEPIGDLVRRTLLLLVDRGRASILHGLADVYETVAMEAAGRVRARVETARPLDDELRARLVAQLETVTGRQVELAETVEDSLLGGMRIFLGSRMIDGSVRGRLESLTEQMLRAPLVAAASNED